MTIEGRLEDPDMNDKDFSELKIRAEIVPQAARWPTGDVQVSIMGDTPTVRGIHWSKLRTVVDEARQRLSTALAVLQEIDADPDLSTDGKARKKKKLAIEAIAGFQNSKALFDARDVVERQLAKWVTETGLNIKSPSNIAEAVLQSEIRAHLAAMKGSKLDFLAKHATDQVVASAILGAPAFLSGLSDNELTFVRQKVEQHLSPEIVKAREATLKAMKEAEQGWQRAIEKIGKRAGLEQRPDGAGLGPSHENAA